MQTVQHTKHFSHPSNWAGYFLIGSDVRLSSKVALMGQALCELLKTPDRCRDALRVILHLVLIFIKIIIVTIIVQIQNNLPFCIELKFRLKNHCNVFIVDRKMQCIPLKRALKIKYVIYSN